MPLSDCGDEQFWITENVPVLYNLPYRETSMILLSGLDHRRKAMPRGQFGSICWSNLFFRGSHRTIFHVDPCNWRFRSRPHRFTFFVKFTTKTSLSLAKNDRNNQYVMLQPCISAENLLAACPVFLTEIAIERSWKRFQSDKSLFVPRYALLELSTKWSNQNQGQIRKRYEERWDKAKVHAETLVEKGQAKRPGQRSYRRSRSGHVAGARDDLHKARVIRSSWCWKNRFRRKIVRCWERDITGSIFSVFLKYFEISTNSYKLGVEKREAITKADGSSLPRIGWNTFFIRLQIRLPLITVTSTPIFLLQTRLWILIKHSTLAPKEYDGLNNTRTQFVILYQCCLSYRMWYHYPVAEALKGSLFVPLLFFQWTYPDYALASKVIF